MKYISSIMVSCFVLILFHGIGFTYDTQNIIQRGVEKFIDSGIVVSGYEAIDALGLFENMYSYKAFDSDTTVSDEKREVIDYILSEIALSLIEKNYIDMSEVWKRYEDDNVGVGFYLPHSASIIFDIEGGRTTRVTYNNILEITMIDILPQEESYYDPDRENFDEGMYQQYFRDIGVVDPPEINQLINDRYIKSGIHDNCTYKEARKSDTSKSGIIKYSYMPKAHTGEKQEGRSNDDACYQLRQKTVLHDSATLKTVETNYGAYPFSNNIGKYLENTIAIY